MSAIETDEPRDGMRLRAAVICSACGHHDWVGCPLNIAPTPEIVEEVCARDPCPACGRPAMEPA